MSAVLDYMHLCRLCLVKDKVNVSIFGETSDVRQLYLKISACLPVKVTQEDRLPKKICDSCVYKVDLLYQFWNTTVSAEKQLLEWSGDVNIKDASTSGGVRGEGVDTLMLPQSHAHPHSTHLETILLKEERLDTADTKLADGFNTGTDLYSQEYELSYQQQQQLQAVTTNYNHTTTTTTSGNATNEQPLLVRAQKRPRGRPPGSTKKKRQSTSTTTAKRTSRASAAHQDSGDERLAVSDEEDLDSGTTGTRIAKEEAESDEDYVDNSESLEPTTFVDVPSTSAACDSELPGPSGISSKSNTTTTSSNSNNNTSNNTEPGLTVKEDPLAEPAALEEDSDSDELSCNVCGRQFTDRKKCVRHRRNHAPRIIPCDLCGALFRFPYQLAVHRRTHSSERRYQCESCGKWYKTQDNLQQHERIHLGRYSVRCAECNKGFSNARSLQQHVDVHHRGITVPCEHCAKRFTCEKNMLDHVTRMHTNQQQLRRELLKVQCKQCERVLVGNIALAYHMRTIHGDGDGENQTTFMCDVCGKSITSKASLTVHMRTHAGIKPYQCTECGQTFISKPILQSHQRTHTNERPYKCAECEKCFTQQSALTIHRRYHTGERPYACEICEKRFVSKSLMKTHLKSHGTSMCDL